MSLREQINGLDNEFPFVSVDLSSFLISSRNTTNRATPGGPKQGEPRIITCGLFAGQRAWPLMKIISISLLHSGLRDNGFWSDLTSQILESLSPGQENH